MLATCLFGVAALSASCGVPDRAQLPRNLVTPNTVAGMVLDLENLSTQAIQPWMETLDPQGQWRHAGDDFVWALENLASTGARRLLWITQAIPGQSTDHALLIHCQTDADPEAMLQALWETGVQLDDSLLPEETALVKWQEQWWALEHSNLWLPDYQESEYGVPLQKALHRGRHAPVRCAFQFPDEVKQAILSNPYSALLLADWGNSLDQLETGLITLDTQGRSPELEVRLEFASRKGARKFESLTNEGSRQFKDSLTELIQFSLMTRNAPSLERLDEMQRTLKKARAQFQFQPAGPATRLTLSNTFFQAIRHLNNLQTQPVSTERAFQGNGANRQGLAKH